MNCLTLLIALGLLISPIAHAHGSRPLPDVGVLMSKALPEWPENEIQVLEVIYPPGGGDPIHRHDAHGIVYVLEGSIVMGVNNSEAVTLVEGDVFYESPDDIHTVGHNASTTLPARFLVYLLKRKDAPVLIPVD